ncbi:MAG: hypothetical protein GC181_16485 [Bacteroidetes bacterium]|nr:hypothetical protein [Bacteroidota bacterium]
MLIKFGVFAQSNELIGITPGGGDYARGAIFRTDSVGNFKAYAHSFFNFQGTKPRGRLLQASNGKYYGVTLTGGNNGKGVLYEYDPDSIKYRVLIQFGDQETGLNPMGSPVEFGSGVLFGTTNLGGDYGKGTIYKYTLSTNSYEKIHDFNGTDGANPEASFLVASNDTLYGLTTKGGSKGTGALYTLEPVSGSVNKVADFVLATTGQSPVGELLEAGNGLFYGVTGSSSSGNGVLFSFDKSNNKILICFEMDGSNTGKLPKGGLIEAPNGLIYGTTAIGGKKNYGIIFEYNPTTNICIQKYSFNNSDMGRQPNGKLCLAKDGVLYGVTYTGGINDYRGIIYRYEPGTDSITKLWDFDNSWSGDQPLYGLIQGSDNRLYGVTSQGGARLAGTLFSFDIDSSKYQRQFYFDGSIYGTEPKGTAFAASNEILYGVTEGGGEYGTGVIYEFNLTNSQFRKLYDINSDSVGRAFTAGVMQASNGKLYGLANYGGPLNLGTFVEFDLNTGILNKIYDFDGGALGAKPDFVLPIEIPGGKLLFTTTEGGSTSNGVLIEYNLTTGNLKAVFNFNGIGAGASPAGNLFLYNDSKVYGITEKGGSSDMGTLFEYDLKKGTVGTIYTFNNKSDGRFPLAGGIVASNGNFYGTTNLGGTYDNGVLYEFNLSSRVYTKRGDFRETYTGKYHYCQPLETTNGRIYGMTYDGGKNSDGVLYEYIPGTKVITNKLDFDRDGSGASPQGNLIEINGCINPKVIQDGNTLTSRKVNVIYRWLNCDNNYEVLEGENDMSFRPDKDGNYALEVTFRNCSDTSECLFLQPSGIAQTTVSRISVFPNPAGDFIRISESISGSYEIYSVHGVLLQSGKLEGDKIDIGNLNSGTTFLLRIKMDYTL